MLRDRVYQASHRHLGSSISTAQIRFHRIVAMCPASLKRANTNDGSVSPPPSKRPVAPKLSSTITKAAVASFFTKTSDKKVIPEKISWRIIQQSLIIGEYLPVEAKTRLKTLLATEKKKIAAFDFDSTLISTASKAKFARDANDWSWWHGSIPTKLKQLYQDGYILVIISNQNGISIKPSTAKNAPKIVRNDRYTQFKQKATAVFSTLNLPMSVYAASEKDQFRKPATGIWKEFLSDHELRVEDVDMEHSIFVGDAGGRTAATYNNKLVKADFSCSDRNFASNVGIRYTTPEEFFLDEEPRPYERTFDPASYISLDPPISRIFSPSKTQEVLVFVGSPGSGKSTYFRRILAPLRYERINQDTLKSRDRCVKVATEALAAGKSVAIDNTNAGQDVRKVWISLAQKYNLPVRCIHFTADRELARHNDSVRAMSGVLTMNPDAREALPPLAFNGFGARFQEPVVEEGFKEVLKVDFVFSGSDEEKSVWGKYWF